MTLFVFYIYLFTFRNDEKLLNVCYGYRVREKLVFEWQIHFKLPIKLFYPIKAKK